MTDLLREIDFHLTIGGKYAVIIKGPRWKHRQTAVLCYIGRGPGRVVRFASPDQRYEWPVLWLVSAQAVSVPDFQAPRREKEKK